MKKEDAVKRINQIGFAGWIIALIAKIVLFIGIAAATIGLILILALIPRGFLTMQGDGAGKISLNLNTIGQEITDKDRTALEAQTGEITSATTMMIDGAVFSMDNPEVDGNEITFDWHFAGSDEEITLDLHNLWVPLLATVLVLVVAQVSVFFISALCKAFRHCASPFDDNVITKMRNLAFSLIPWTVMSNITDNVWANVLRANPLYTFNLSIDFGMIIVVLIVFALTYIFKYGAVLQRESDETL